jgi:hypothetical protein
MLRACRSNQRRAPRHARVPQVDVVPVAGVREGQRILPTGSSAARETVTGSGGGAAGSSRIAAMCS